MHCNDIIIIVRLKYVTNLKVVRKYYNVFTQKHYHDAEAGHHARIQHNVKLCNLKMMSTH